MSQGDAEFEAINACVERILSSDSFSRSPQARHFLRYVVDGARKKDSELLKAYTIGVHALGATGERSNPETTARMQAGRVRRLLAKYYEGEGKDEALELRLPTRRYAPEYIPRRSKSVPPKIEPTLGYELPTLYIGEFESHSKDSQDVLFCRAFAEEVTELLVEMDGLGISDAAPRDLSEANALILTASISRVDKELRVVSRLRSLDGQQMLWSDHFDADLSEGEAQKMLDTLAELLASQVGDSVHGAFLRIVHRNESASVGYRGVQRALRYLASPTSSHLDEVIAGLETSLQTASDQALPHALYANLVALRCLRSASSRGSDLLSAEAHAQSALDLDPECAWAHFAKAQVHYHHREPTSAERELSLALECERASVTIQALAGNLYCLLGVWSRGVELIRQAQAKQARLSGYLGLGLCLYYFFEKSDPERAQQVAEDCELKETPWGAVLQVCCLGLLGRRVESRQLVARIIQNSPHLPKTFSKHVHEILPLPKLASALVTGAGEAGLLPRYDSPPQSVRLSIATSRAPLPREIRVGILHSLSGPMAISEAHLVNAAMLAIEEINAQGGLLGRPVRGIIKDGCSDPQIFRKRAEELISEEGVLGLFGCWMSSSRKAVLPVVERHGSLLWYPVQYEGLEGSRNIVYTGSCLNQQVEPGVRWAIRKGRTRSFLVGSDYVYPRTVNRLIRGLVAAAQGEVVGERYQKVGAGDFDGIVQEIQLKRPDIVYNTLNGADNVAFFQALRRAGISPEQSLVMSFSLSELELSRCGDLAEGHLAVASYFQSMASPENKDITERFRRRYGQETVLSDPSVTAYAQLHLYKEVVEKAGSLETEAILHHLPKCHLHLGGEVLEMQSNNHAERRAIIGKIVANRQFQVLWRSNRQITPQPWLGVEESDLKTRELVLQALRALPEMAEQSSPLESHAARS